MLQSDCNYAFDKFYSGAVLANRLSEIKKWKILLLEAGKYETLITDIPLLAAAAQLTSLDWQYKTEPQPTSCLGKKNLTTIS